MSFQNETGENLNDNLITKQTEQGQLCPYKKDIHPEFKGEAREIIIQESIPLEKDIESPSSPVETISKKKKWLFIELNPGISYFNLYSYYLVQFSYVCFCTYMDACQDYLLEDKRYYGIDKNEVGAINGDILLSDTLYLICFIYLYGSFHDIFGRKAMVVYGFLSMALSLALYPLAGKVYPNLILVRLIFSNGICAVTTQPLLADYVNHKTKGFVGGIAAVVSGMGAIFAAVVLIKLQNYTDIKNVYFLTSGMCLVAAIICVFGVKNIKRAEAETNILKRFQNLIVKLKEGFQEVKTNLPLRIGIVTNSLARMNTLLITLFLVMWVKQFESSDEKAVNRGHMIGGIGNSFGLISALLFGCLLEKKRVSTFLILSNIMVIGGYIGFYICSDPDHWLVFISISIASFGFYGLMTLGYVLVNLHCGHKARGSVMGLNCLFGAIAILIIAKLGGLAFDKIDKSFPFLFSAAGSFILLIVVLFTKKELDNAKPPGCPIDHSKAAIISSNESS